ncbi:MAG: nuclear transport factor 2 family protein [Methylacidiphilales bacterium]|nr:nuclear transport factor 2 family protein [Candidatus Methylacidiphilales bacterium]NJR15077.1 nuclear transport factor 2 family protein [Calothrix sp. CSU_2_0]
MSQYSQAEIVEIEERLRQAMLNSDVVELDALIAPELIFTNHLGQLCSKEEDLAAHRSGVIKFKEITPSEQRIQIHDGFAIASVNMHVVGSYEGTENDCSIRFTRVWSKSSTGSLQIVAGHTSIVSA